MGTYNQDWLDAEWELMDKTRDLKAERDALAAELAALREQETVYASSLVDYSYEGMGCGLEDRGIVDRYDAMKYGWDEAIDSVDRAGPFWLEPMPHPLLTYAELKLIMDARAFREKMMSVDTTMTRAEAVFAAPKEDFDWPEDRGEHPQKGLGQS